MGNQITIDDLGSPEDPGGGQIAEWIKALLPKSQSGWWEVAPKGKGLSVKFRWRDPDRQTLLFPQISSGQIELLRKHDSGEVAKILGEQIALQLHTLSLDPAKRDKALLAAQKLGIDLDSAPTVNAAKK